MTTESENCRVWETDFLKNILITEFPLLWCNQSWALGKNWVITRLDSWVSYLSKDYMLKRNDKTSQSLHYIDKFIIVVPLFRWPHYKYKGAYICISLTWIRGSKVSSVSRSPGAVPGVLLHPPGSPIPSIAVSWSSLHKSRQIFIHICKHVNFRSRFYLAVRVEWSLGHSKGMNVILKKIRSIKYKGTEVCDSYFKGDSREWHINKGSRVFLQGEVQHLNARII